MLSITLANKSESNIHYSLREIMHSLLAQLLTSVICQCLDAMAAPSFDNSVLLKVGNSVFSTNELSIDGATVAFKP